MCLAPWNQNIAENTKQAVAEVVPSSHSVQVKFRFRWRLTDQKLDQHVRSWMTVSKVGSTDQNLDQQLKICINRSKGISTKQKLDQKLDQHFKIQINGSKVRLTDKKLDWQIKS